ncbi:MULTISPECIES: TonB-dependent receptor [unclassified Spirosoma]|uniref:TonB-dependent receptor domain-containing protein n=1 Tax=unclassified Spirosoma TaxID=2621999 RepID=UPI000964ECBC|nr:MULTISPECIES: TonB-dependent receptor [unclassified Spirosoma]MBN8822772.1 TonB-dependent receptor [Spirosoma sp.]OJW79982.1 MAG: TonB-dependent receptor [Spirosoma sp. 48-14]
MNTLRFYFILSFLSIIIQGKSQQLPPNPASPTTKGQLSGMLTDSTTRQPVPFATVALLTATGTIITGQTTTETGHFTFTGLAIGTYAVQISYVGYQPRTLIGITILASQPTRDLGTILLRSESRQLNEVRVTTQKALIEEKSDRLVYNAGSDITNKGGTAVDVLRKAPMLTVDVSGNVQIRGSSSIKVLLNGRPSGLLARNLSEALKMIPANTIQSVEVITSPAARYDAEGAGGVINIITKKQLKGSNGSLDVTAGNYIQSLGGSYGFKREKFGLTFSGNTNAEREKSIIETTRTSLVNGQPAGELFQRISANNIHPGWFGDLGMEYAFDTLNRVNLSVSSWGGAWPTSNTGYYRFRNTENQISQEYKQVVDQQNPFGNIEWNLGYTRTFHKPKQELSVLGQYSYTFDNSRYASDQFSLTDQPLYRETSTNRSHNPQWTWQIDYVHPFSRNGQQVFEVGAKMVRRDVSSTYEVYTSQPENIALLNLSTDRSNTFTYDQQVAAGYASLKLANRTHWTLQLGTRLENTSMSGQFAHTISPFRVQFNNFIPSIILSKQLTEQQSVKVTYTQRISRPMIWDLNPYVNASDPKNRMAGNPQLRPELAHLAEISYSLTTPKGTYLNLALYRRQTDNSIEDVRTVDTAGVSLTTRQNVARNERTGLNVNASGQLGRNWKLNGGGEFYYAHFSSPALQVQNSGWLWQFTLNLAYQLPRQFTVQANGIYSTGWVLLQGKNSAWYDYSLAVRKEFWDKKASLTLGVNNPFTYPFRQQNDSQSSTFRAHTANQYFTRSVKLTFSWQFGQIRTSHDEPVRKITNDDARAK